MLCMGSVGNGSRLCLKSVQETIIVRGKRVNCLVLFQLPFLKVWFSLVFKRYCSNWHSAGCQQWGNPGNPCSSIWRWVFNRLFIIKRGHQKQVSQNLRGEFWALGFDSFNLTIDHTWAFSALCIKTHISKGSSFWETFFDDENWLEMDKFFPCHMYFTFQSFLLQTYDLEVLKSCLFLQNQQKECAKFCWYRVIQANAPIKNRHFSASDEAREILKSVLSSYINPI